MQLYPHWLDGEFVRIASKADGEKQTLKALTRVLKLHALIGTEFVLNDVQVFDSAAVLELFADPEFRAFVERDRDFLYLKVNPTGGLGDSPFQLAARGLMRTQKPDWISSAFFGKDALVKTLADEIINQIQSDNCVDPGRHSPAANVQSDYREKLNAARHAVYYFATCPTQAELTASPCGVQSNYYEVLKETLSALERRGRDHATLPESETPSGLNLLMKTRTDMEIIGDVINFIDIHIPDENERKFRSKVLAILQGQQILDKEQGILIWNNVVQAWSYATAQTMGQDGMSSAWLPGAVSPAPILDRQMDVLVPFDNRKQKEPMYSITNVPVLPVDLDGITWAQVAEARVRTRTAGSLQALARVRALHPGNIEAISGELREHMVALGKVLVPSKKAPHSFPIVPYLFVLGGTGASVTIGVFGNLDIMTTRQVLVSIGAGAAAVAGAFGKDIWRDYCGQWMVRRAFVNSMNAAADGSN